MLRITQSTSSEAAKHYFGQSLKRGDYYFEDQEIVGEWGGKGAKLLGLEGKVDHEGFVMLLSNKRPDGKALTVRNAPNRRPGYDFTFDVPKSVSLLYALAGDERIATAMRSAAEETMSVLEKEMHARVRKNGAFHDRKTGNMIRADFTHLTSRPSRYTAKEEAELLRANPWLKDFKEADGNLYLPDPHLHVHIYAINATMDNEEGIWKAGEFMRIKRDAAYHQAAYHIRLAQNLQRLGYDIAPTAKAFEVAGVSRELIEKFSRRTKEVEETATRLGIHDARKKDKLGAQTRHAKQSDIGMSELKRAWKSAAGKAESEQLDRIAWRAKHNLSTTAKNDRKSADAAIDYALERELERASEVRERRLLTTAFEKAVGQSDIATVELSLKAQKHVLRAKVDEETHLTTMEILKEETELMKFIRDGRGSMRPIVEGKYEFKNPLLLNDTLGSKEQREAVSHVLNSKDWVVGLIGRAGTGKTTLLKEIETATREEWKGLVVCAPTAEASRGVLREAGFADAETIKQLLANESKHHLLKDSVLWVDEAGMVGNRDMLALLKLAKDQGAAKVVLAGDPSQIRSVPRGDTLRFLEENAGLSVARLSTIQRQKAEVLRESVEAISQRDIEGAFKKLDQAGAIIEDKPEEYHAQLAEEYTSKVSQSKSVIAVSPTHAECEATTQAIRDSLRNKGLLGHETREFDQTINLGWTESQKRNPADYEADMVVQFKRRLALFDQGERVLVEEVDARRGKVFIRDNGGTVSELPIEKSESFQVYRHQKIEISPGERIRVLENAKIDGLRVNNGAAYTVEGFTENGDIRLTNGREIPKEFGHINHGYVITADAAQSKTVDTVLAAIGSDSMSAADMRRFYVTVSRAREEVKVFTDDREELQLACQRDSVRMSATELLGGQYDEAELIGIEPQEEFETLSQSLASQVEPEEEPPEPDYEIEEDFEPEPELEYGS